MSKKSRKIMGALFVAVVALGGAGCLAVGEDLTPAEEAAELGGLTVEEVDRDPVSVVGVACVNRFAGGEVTSNDRCHGEAEATTRADVVDRTDLHEVDPSGNVVVTDVDGSRAPVVRDGSIDELVRQ